MMSSKKPWIAGSRLFESSLKWLLWIVVASYRTIGTTHMGGACRFTPHCSEYALEAMRVHKPSTALKLIISRVWRCRPFGKYGYDPVPTCCSGDHNHG